MMLDSARQLRDLGTLTATSLACVVVTVVCLLSPTAVSAVEHDPEADNRARPGNAPSEGQLSFAEVTGPVDLANCGHFKVTTLQQKIGRVASPCSGLSGGFVVRPDDYCVFLVDGRYTHQENYGDGRWRRREVEWDGEVANCVRLSSSEEAWGGADIALVALHAPLVPRARLSRKRHRGRPIFLSNHSTRTSRAAVATLPLREPRADLLLSLPPPGSGSSGKSG